MSESDNTQAPKVSKKSKKRVSNKDYVQAYLLYKSYPELAEAIGLSRASVASRANKLRKAGVNLPKYVRAKSELDVAGLNSLIG